MKTNTLNTEIAGLTPRLVESATIHVVPASALMTGLPSASSLEGRQQDGRSTADSHTTMNTNSDKGSGMPRSSLSRGLDSQIRSTSYYKRNCSSLKQRRYVRRLIEGVGIYEYKPVPCRCWTCATCGPDFRLALLRQALEQHIPDHDLGSYVTFTIPKKPGTAAELSKAITKALGKTLRAYAKKTGTKLSFVWIKEIKQGRPHLHTFLPRSIRRKQLKKLWHHYTGGEQVRFRTIDFGTISRLVGYNTKGIIAAARMHGTSCGRWYGTSRDIRICIDRPKGENEHGWTFINGKVDFTKIQAQIVEKDRLGYPVRFLTHVDAPPRRTSSMPRHAAVHEGSEGAQPPLDPKVHAAGPGGDDPAPGEAQP